MACITSRPPERRRRTPVEHPQVAAALRWQLTKQPATEMTPSDIGNVGRVSDGSLAAIAAMLADCEPLDIWAMTEPEPRWTFTEGGAAWAR